MIQKCKHGSNAWRIGKWASVVKVCALCGQVRWLRPEYLDNALGFWSTNNIAHSKRWGIKIPTPKYVDIDIIKRG